MPIKIIYTETDYDEVQRILRSVGFGPYIADRILGACKSRRHNKESRVQVVCSQHLKSEFPEIYRPGRDGQITRICLEDLTSLPFPGKNGNSLCKIASQAYQSLVAKLVNPEVVDSKLFVRS